MTGPTRTILTSPRYSQSLRNAGEVYRASGMWCCFFHIAADMFGMENYFIKMHTNPDVVDAVTRHICEFYLEANERFFEQAGSEIDALFFGNDLGTQLDLLVSPDQLERFIMPYTRKFVEQGHAHGYQVMHHCCGAIHKIIPSFIDAGVDALHPLQAKAANMDAETLARDFKGRIAFRRRDRYAGSARARHAGADSGRCPQSEESARAESCGQPEPRGAAAERAAGECDRDGGGSQTFG